MKRITGHLEEKNGKYYAAVNHYTVDGKRKVKWHSLDLPVAKGNKREANYRLNQLLEKFNSGENYLSDAMTPAERERNRLAESYVEDYLLEWVESHKMNVSASTYEGYKNYIESKMIPYFKKLHIKVKELSGDEINGFYQEMNKLGFKGSTLQRYHAVLHLAFKTGMKRKIIPTNPVEQADRPKAEPFIADYYNADEIKTLLEVSEKDELHLIIKLACYYGLRRSEVLGIKWSAIDFIEKTISIKHKVLSEDDGPQGYDVMKTKSSFRTMPLLPFIEEELRKEKARQTELKRVMGRAYIDEYDDYVCTDALGRLYDPDYITNHFKVILRKNKLRNIRFHELRHSCASLLLAKGIPMKMIQDWLGHSDMSTTANIYSHIDSTSKKETAQAIGELLG